MEKREFAACLIASRKALKSESLSPVVLRKGEAEGGCGVIGIACSEQIPARHMLQSLRQMRNRGNNKGGGIAAVGLVPEQLGVSREVLERDYLLTIAYLDLSARHEVESAHITPTFDVDHVRHVPQVGDYHSIPGLEIQPPDVYQYFVRVKRECVEEYAKNNGMDHNSSAHFLLRIEDELVYQNTYRLNRAFYASTGERKAFVLSHGKNMFVLKMVGYGDDVVRYYQLEDLRAHVWIGHHRYPTKGKVWHPGGAHPFVGLHEALVHNGDFANYASICEYLAQRNIYPLFLTDTEVSVLVFDLLYRVYGYPLEYVIESLAPTTERDFALLPKEKQHIYQILQNVHIHSSPDGPWFFLIAQSVQSERSFRLIGITDTSMLRPQVFALQEGPASIGFAASEKQAIDAALESLAAEDSRFWGRADRYWNARGGSHTDGGAFVFTVGPKEDNLLDGKATLVCTDKFGKRITLNGMKHPHIRSEGGTRNHSKLRSGLSPRLSGRELFNHIVGHFPEWGYEDILAFLSEIEASARRDADYRRALELLTLLIDRRFPTGEMRRSSLLVLFDQCLSSLVESIKRSPSDGYAYTSAETERPSPSHKNQSIIIDARGFAPEGERSLALDVVRLYKQGWRKFLLAHTRGHRFIANGLGPGTNDVRIDVYGSSGDYLASGIDGAHVFVHGSGQDQLAQIMKHGSLVVHGDVGQTFMYGAKGGKVFVLGNAAGRPLINAVGKPRVVINGTCLDYLAESFMAGDPFSDGGFVIINGITFDDDGQITELETPYPGGNLFSLASGGAIYVRDPSRRVSQEQLNGGEFVDFEGRDWPLIRPYLEENEHLFGIPVSRLLTVGDKILSAERVYRKIRPSTLHVLQAEEAWVKMRV